MQAVRAASEAAAMDASLMPSALRHTTAGVDWPELTVREPEKRL